MIGHTARRNSSVLVVMRTSDSKRKRGRPSATWKDLLKNDLRNMARIAGIDGTNILYDIRKIDKNVSSYHNRSMII